MKNELVFTKQSEVWSDSLIFAYNFNLPHTEIRRKIKNLTMENPMLKTMFVEVDYTNDRNRTYKKYLLNRDGYMFLVMNTHTEGANKVKLRFIQAFNHMERALMNQENATWIEAREEGKQSRLEETNVIKKFVDYATEQGSKSAKFYYANITKMTYKALEMLDQNKTTPIREFITGAELWNLRLAEEKVTESLIQGMSDELHYKEIYILAKQELIQLMDLMPKKHLLV